MAWHILMQGHLQLLSLMWCQAIYNLWWLYCVEMSILEVVNVWRPGRCRWLGISWCKAICSFWVWCGAKPFKTFGCHAVLGQVFWRLWMFGGLVGADGLAYLDARPSAASEFDVVPSHLHPLVVALYWDGYFWEVVSVWQPGRCRWLGISWCQAISCYEFIVVPSHLQPLNDQGAC